MPWEVAGPTGVRVMPSRKGETAMVAGSMILTLGSIAPARVSGFKQTTSERSFSVSLTKSERGTVTHGVPTHLVTLRQTGCSAVTSGHTATFH